MKEKAKQFIVTGFRQHLQFRMFTFERVAEDYTRSAYTVSADTALVRKHGISVQELPLLCLKLLERLEIAGSCQNQPDQDQRAFTFTEEDMLSYTKTLAALREASKQKRRFGPKPFVDTSTSPPQS